MRYTLEGDRDAHKFTLQNAYKDMRYLESMADAAGVANPMGNAVKNAFGLAVATGKGQDYVPMLAENVAAANGVKLTRK
jgi:3-hydroxyisobutyrate dehydrogenase-like beta-hydroxyacid dehydrogenase